MRTICVSCSTVDWWCVIGQEKAASIQQQLVKTHPGTKIYTNSNINS